MENNAQEGGVDVETAIVLNEAIFLNLFMKKLTRERVVPIISARVSCDILATTF